MFASIASESIQIRINILTVQGELLATQQQWVESSTGVSLAMVGLYKALGGGWESVYPVAEMAQR